MNDNRGRRAWIKVQLNDSTIAHEAAALVRDWKAARQAASQLVKAVRLYAALCRGDLSLLYEYFPGLSLAVSNRPATVRPVPSVAVTYASKPDEDVLAEALDGLGLDDLDFTT